jgi:3-dehydroquinate dehydratase-1
MAPGGTGMSALIVKGLAIGEGTPKICVPLVGATRAALRAEARIAAACGADLAELRIDRFDGVADPAEVGRAIRDVAGILGTMPLLFTFRTDREGGSRPISAADYAALNRGACDTGLADLIDVELFAEEPVRDGLIAYAHERGVKVVVSNHDFQKTPSAEELVSRLALAARIGGDLPKIAVMPRSPEDVLVLLSATVQARKVLGDTPIATMSMSGLGAVSRFAGEVFGSALTFGSAAEASAPGQVPVSRLRAALDLFRPAR